MLPGTSPPPNTRSTSAIPEVSLAASALETEPIGSTAAAPARPAAAERCVARLARGATYVSTSVFQAPQEGHWPAHLGVLAAQLWQTYSDRLAGTRVAL
jgi:hypothetical protein